VDAASAGCCRVVGAINRSSSLVEGVCVYSIRLATWNNVAHWTCLSSSKRSRSTRIPVYTDKRALLPSNKGLTG
jgi:hypothetical protein